jgi:hypothetical protein
VATPPPEEDETPDEDEIPDDEDVPVELLVDDDPPDEDDPPIDRCGSDGVKCANLAPMTAAAAAESRPTRQVIFRTRRRPSSRARASLEYWVGVTASASPVILCDPAEPLLRGVRTARTPGKLNASPGKVFRNYQERLSVSSQRARQPTVYA